MDSSPPPEIALDGTFTFVHGSHAKGSESVPDLGHSELRSLLVSRLRHSPGGVFLLGGFRGVGKSTLVRQAIDQLERELSDDHVVVADLNVARPLASSDLLFSIMRRLVEGLIQTGLIRRIDGAVSRDILVAYARTSMSIGRKSTEATEDSVKFTTGLALAQNAFAKLSAGAEVSSKQTRALETSTAFLAYSETDAEYDLAKIVRLLGENPPRMRKRWWSLTRSASSIRILVILDELDKLTATDEGVAAFEQILGVLKNLANTAGIYIVWVTGTDVLDAAAVDEVRGLGIYESVFAWRAYVPCLWDAPELLVARWVQEGGTFATGLQQYLKYRSRGIPRRLLQEFNDMISIDAKGISSLRPSHGALAAIQFYGNLQDMLDVFLQSIEADIDAGLAYDRTRLSCYFALDWVLRSEGGVFTPADLISHETGIDGSLRAQSATIRRLLEHLATHDLLETLTMPSGNVTRIRGVQEQPSERYRLSSVARGLLTDLAKESDRERLFLLMPSVHPQDQPPSLGAPSPPSSPTSYPALRNQTFDADWAVPRNERFLGNGRYELVDLIGAGGMGVVYRAHDHVRGDECALKMLQGVDSGDSTLRSRFRREAQIGLRLSHKSLVRVRELLEEPDGRIAIVMDLVEGTSLRHVIEAGISQREAVSIMVDLLAAIAHCQEQGVVRLDIKPENVIRSSDGSAVLVDLGVAKEALHEDRIPNMADTIGRLVVGTPRYLAPEQWERMPLTDATDVYAAGVVLLETLRGVSETTPPSPDLARARAAQVPELRGVSDALRDVVGEMLAVQPADRYPNAQEARDALSSTPEAMSAS